MATPRRIRPEGSLKQYADSAGTKQLKEWLGLVAQVQASLKASDEAKAKVNHRLELEGQLASFKQQVKDAQAKKKPPESIKSLEKIVDATEKQLKAETP